MKKMLLLACILAFSVASAAGNEDCVRYFDTKKGTVLESCTPTKPPPELAPGSRPLSVTAPELRLPAGVIPAVVEKVIDPITLQLRYGYSSNTVRLRDIAMPAKGTAEYRQALAVMKSLAPASSVLYLENSYDKAADNATLVNLWQLSNFLSLILVEQGLASYVPNVDSDYDDVLSAASAFAKENKVGIWKDAN